MRKLLILAMVLALVAPAMAADNLTISGAYEVFGIGADNLQEQKNHNGVDLEDADNVNYFYQRFRVQPKFKATDGVSATLRFDFAEGIWGQDQAFTSARTADSAEIQVDRAYVSVNKGILMVNAGLQFVPLGQTQVFRDNQPALQFIFKTPVSVRLGWVKVDESIGVSTGALSDEADDNKDTDRYLIDVGYKSKTFGINAFYAMQQDGSTGDSDADGIQDNFEDQPTVMGVNVKAKAGRVALYGEAASFGGDNGNGTDYVGTQVNVNGRMKLSDALTVAADLWYSKGAEPGERKRIHIGNPFARFDLKKGAAMGWDTLTYGRNPAELFSTSPPGGLLPGDVFDPFLTGAGSMGAGIGAKFNPVEPLTLIGHMHYMVGESDDTGVVGEFDSGYSALVCAVYQLAPKTSLHATYHLIEASFLDDIEVNSAHMYTLWMKVAF
jgi:hypothetical protein